LATLSVIPLAIELVKLWGLLLATLLVTQWATQ
jgi:hypothetical protein